MEKIDTQAALIINTVSKDNFNDLCATISSDVEKDQLYIVNSNEEINTVIPSKKYTDEKLYIENYVDGSKTSGYSNLSVVKISDDEYQRIVADSEDADLSNIMFVISSDNMNMHNQSIVNTSISGLYNGDVATVTFVQQAILALSNAIINNNNTELLEILNFGKNS